MIKPTLNEPQLSQAVDSTHAEEIGEVFEHSDPYFVQILEESVKHRHEVARSVLLPDNHSELVDREGQRPTHLPLQHKHRNKTLFIDHTIQPQYTAEI